MAKVDLPYVQRFDDRHGKPRHYFRRPGFPRASLPGEVGSTEFMDAYGECLKAAKVTAGEKRTIPYSISALIIAYYATAEFKRLEDSTKITYRSLLDRFRDKYGHLSAKGIRTRHLDAIFNEMAATPGAAKNLRKRLRRVFRQAVKMEWRVDNPVTETDRPETDGNGFLPWTDADIAAFEKRWPSGTRERRAFALLLYTGVRRSNAVGMGRQHVQGEKIRVDVFKGRKRTPTTLLIPIHPNLKIEIDATTELTFIMTQYGAPFTYNGFGQWFVEAAEAAGIEGKTAHGLRKAAGRHLAEAGCTAKEIAAILGHRSLSEVARYTRDADQSKLADRAMGKLTSQAV